MDGFNRRDLVVLLTTLLVAIAEGDWHAHSGPWVNATEGEPWPQVKDRVVNRNDFFIIDSSFQIEVINGQDNNRCNILNNAIERYGRIVSQELKVASKFKSKVHSGRSLGRLPRLVIHLINTTTCPEMPSLSMNEEYHLSIGNNTNKAVLTANAVWGVLRGLETFSQLLVPTGDGKTLSVRLQFVHDKPYFRHRGLLLDTSRHYIPLSDIFLTLDAMSYNKLNVLHWHIVDDNSFPYESLKFPNLSAKGAYHPTMIYTWRNIVNVVYEARLRGIRVIVEFDSPGHVASWGLAYPNLLTTCYDSQGRPNGELGPINPTNPKVYEFLKSLFDEAIQLFPDKYFHLGGDEVPFDCWNSNPDVKAYMEYYDIKNAKELEEMYIGRVINITDSLGKNSIVWQEVFDINVTMPANTVVHVWTGDFLPELERVTKKGYRALLSTCWYLDHVSGGGDWQKFYKCDISSFKGDKELFIGGEACMWGEFVDKNNLHSRIWPRASATAERLWSYYPENIKNVEKRLEEHACRMNRRGIPAQPPNGAGFCVL